LRVIERRFGWTAACFAAVIVTVIAEIATQRANAQQTADIDQDKVDQDKVDHGKAIYAERCSHCHGPGMLNPGTITPDLRRFPNDRNRFVSTVKLGKNNKMPPWGDLLGDEEIASLWAYISSQRKP
jgi:mono/diheme cytochrome c family protein